MWEGRAGGWFHYVNDPIGTPERLIGSDGGVVCELYRKAWGESEEVPGGEATTSLRLQGQYEDEETGLSYNRWRYFCLDTGRFISRDPIGLTGGLSGYSFEGNPHRNIDPYGLSQLTIISSAITPSGAPGAVPGPALLRGGRICTGELSKSIPSGTPNTWNPHAPPTGGYSGPGFKYEWTDAATGTRYRVWGHEANPNAPPGTNAAAGPHVRIRIGNQFMTDSGTTVGNPNTPVNANPTHIPLDL